MERHPVGLHNDGAIPTGPAGGRGNAPVPDEPLDPGTALAIVQNAERSTRRQLNGNTPLVYLLWGLAWLAGYGALEGSRRGWLPLEPPSALVVLGAVLLVATAATVALSVRGSLGIRGHSAFQGGMHGASSGPDHFLTVYLYLGSGGMLAGSLAEYLATRSRTPGVSRA